MLNDKYLLKSTISAPRKGVQQNVKTFLDLFNVFYDKIRQGGHPSLYHDMCDPYGFALLCKDYKSSDRKYDMNMTCEDIFNEKATENHIDCITYDGQFSFIEILNFLYRGFWFNYDKAIEVYDNQHDAFHIFNQIINGNGFIFNRVRPDLKKARLSMKNATESSVELDENSHIELPHIWRLCDGMPAPFIVTKHYREMSVEKCECHGYGEGLFVLANNEIIDCLKINDTWFVDLPLEDRLKFAYDCTDHDVAQYGKAWSWRSILDVGKMLKANSTNGLLIRGCRDSFLKTRWFNWSKTSLIYCFKNNGELVANMRGRKEPTFYTLEGDEGIINPIEERKTERVFLDNFDIKEFQKILELKYNAN